jgi:hypothetical protein
MLDFHLHLSPEARVVHRIFSEYPQHSTGFKIQAIDRPFGAGKNSFLISLIPFRVLIARGSGFKRE